MSGFAIGLPTGLHTVDFPPHLCPSLDLHFEVNQTSPHCGMERVARSEAVAVSKLLWVISGDGTGQSFSA